MTSLLHDIGKYWLKARGRNRPIPLYSFPENEIVTPGYPLRVSSWWNGIYVNLHPAHYAVAIAPDGKRVQLRSGYNYPLDGGQYTLHYIDKQNRVAAIPRISEITLDGSQVSLKLLVAYRVADPIRALEVREPVNALLRFIQSDLKEFIRSHKYGEILGNEDGHTGENDLVVRYVREQHAGRHQMSKLFFLADVVVEEKVGEPKPTEIRENFQAEQRQNIAKSEILQQNQDLERKVAAQEAEIQRIKSQSDAAQQDILQSMQLQKIELEKARRELQFRQDRMNRAMDAIAKAFSTPAYPRDPREVEIIKELLSALEDSSGSSSGGTDASDGQEASESSKTRNYEKIDALTDILKTSFHQPEVASPPEAKEKAKPTLSKPRHRAEPPAQEPPVKIGDKPSDEVTFTAFHPREGKVDTWHTLLVYAHLLSAVEQVHRDVKRFKDELPAPKETSSPSSTRIVRGTEITVVPVCEGLTFNPERITLKWMEDFHRAEFRFQADKSLAGDAAKGYISIYVGPLIIGTLKFAMLFTDKDLASAPDHEEQANMYRKDEIFISYSHKDTDIALIFRNVLEATGYDVLIDVDDLRAGQVWNEELMRMIEGADIFELFWSSNSCQSEYCRQEWEHALKQNKGEGFIRPVYWQKPLPPPPQELSKFHFDYIELKMPTAPGD